MGPPGSANWLAMLDGAEAILCEEGYGALTSRRVAEKVGVKQRLVYYYFRTMEDLTVETFRRLAVRDLERLRAAVASSTPLRAIWQIYTDTETFSNDPRLISEFMALANRIDALRAEVVSYIDEVRRIQTAAIADALARSDITSTIAPVALDMFVQGIALLLNRESGIGMVNGHAEALAAIEAALARVEPIG
ncbi:MAG: TetR/AcrR family transcriptional regulator [Sphingomonadales bacterium]|nr:TetR/AcrR family transcriptional regulator [Sphingomonadales bacterium]